MADRELANIDPGLWRAFDPYTRQQLVHELLAQGFFPVSSPIIYDATEPPVMVRSTNEFDRFTESGGLVIGVSAEDPPPAPAGFPWLWLAVGALAGVVITRI